MRILLFTTMFIGTPTAFVVVGWCLYGAAGRPESEFQGKLGELALQLAVVVIMGALVKVAVDWGVAQRAHEREVRERRHEFLRRVRSIHVTIQSAKDLLNAHRSARTWSEQSRRLMALRPEIEEIAEDLKASQGLFKSQAQIILGLEAVVSYLARSGEEYVRCHGAVSSDRKGEIDLAHTIIQESMTWVDDFMAGGSEYLQHYEANLIRAKVAMRAEVYGA